MRARYGLTPRRVASSMARCTRAAWRPRTARTAGRRRSRGRARMKAGDACVALQAPGRSGGNAQSQRVARRSPSLRRGRAKKHAHKQSRRFRYPEVAPDVSVQRLAHGPLRCYGRFSVHDRGNKATLLGLEEPGAHVGREHLAIPRGMFPSRSPQGRPTPTSPPSRTAAIASTVSGTASAALTASCDD